MRGALLDYGVCTLTRAHVETVPIEGSAGAAQHHELVQAMMSAAILEQKMLRCWLANVGRRNAYHRLAWLICELHERLSRLGLADNAGFECPLTQEAMADAVGLTSVHINRVFKQFRSDMLFSFRSGRVIFDDLQRLKTMCGFDPSYLHLDPSYSSNRPPSDHQINMS
jgi:CRP-like cAMP-binding protein